MQAINEEDERAVAAQKLGRLRDWLEVAKKQPIL
jgi:hypothetical protein